MIHELKTWPEFFDDMVSGLKSFEIRQNDRFFKVGDVLVLQEYDPKKQQYSEREYCCRVIYIVPGGRFGIDPNYVVMGVAELAPNVCIGCGQYIGMHAETYKNCCTEKCYNQNTIPF